jgi:predicted acylesterase/phospholipase RssA/CheY-like chemotaxis protein/CRP-like cAMP-binding protein
MMTGNGFGSEGLEMPDQRSRPISGADALRHLRHDLRTPLTHILGYAELLVEEAADTGPLTLAADLERISTSARTLLALVDEVVDGEDPRRAPIEAHRIDHQLRTLLTAIMGYAELVADQLEEAGAGRLLGDVERIRSAAAELLGRVEHALEHIDNSTRSGAGEDLESAAGDRSQTPVSRRGTRAVGRLLVVDDDATNRELLSRRLTRLGYVVELVDNGAEALARIAAGPFELILLDVIMPGLSGTDVLQQLKADQHLRELPVIMLSALDEIQEAARCIELGADDYLAKPFNPVLLLARIEACLERKRLRDRELEYLQRVAEVTGPAAIAELLYRYHASGIPTSPGAPDGDGSPNTSEEEAALLRDLESLVEWVEVGKGQRLISQGEPSDSVYVLMSGRLQVSRDEPDGTTRVVGDISQGETVGEWGLLSGEPRSATVVANRDSSLARITSSAFARLVSRHSRILTNASQDVVGRLRQAFQSHWGGPGVTAIALVPLSARVPLAQLARDLVRELGAFGSTLHLDRARIRELLGQDAAQELEEHVSATRVSGWLNDLEAQHRFAVYEADLTARAWTTRCIRQADRVLLVAEADGAPAPDWLAAEIDRAGSVESPTQRELVLLHSRRQPVSAGTARWLGEPGMRAHHHVTLRSGDDVQRLARRLAGRAIGVVLSGGGLRGAAHVGVLRALQEAGIHVDFVGGTSAGSLVAAQYALGWSIEEMRARTHELIVRRRALADYTLPIVSLIAGQRYVRALQEMFGDTCIEDVWLPYFCVSSNLTRAEVVVHRQGLLGRAIRASCAIPGVFPPIQDGRGDLLVDGGLLNNLPADVMSRLCDGGPVIAVDLRVKVDLAEGFKFGDSVSGGRLVLNRLNPFASERSSVPNMLAVLLRSTLLGSVHAGADQRRAARFYINPSVEHFPLLDGRAADAIYDLGYRTACQALEQWASDGSFDSLATPRAVLEHVAGA